MKPRMQEKQASKNCNHSSEAVDIPKATSQFTLKMQCFRKRSLGGAGNVVQQLLVWQKTWGKLKNLNNL